MHMPMYTHSSPLLPGTNTKPVPSLLTVWPMKHEYKSCALSLSSLLGSSILIPFPRPLARQSCIEEGSILGPWSSGRGRGFLTTRIREWQEREIYFYSIRSLRFWWQITLFIWTKIVLEYEHWGECYVLNKDYDWYLMMSVWGNGWAICTRGLIYKDRANPVKFHDCSQKPLWPYWAM